MWFKNLQIYRLPTPWNIELAKFDELLSRAPFNRCPSNEPLSKGWISPRRDGSLVFSLGGQWLIALAVEQRLLPSSQTVEGIARARYRRVDAACLYPPAHHVRLD